MNGVSRTMSFDAAGRVVSATFNGGAPITFGYDYRNWRISAQTPAGSHTWTWGVDELLAEDGTSYDCLGGLVVGIGSQAVLHDAMESAVVIPGLSKLRPSERATALRLQAKLGVSVKLRYDEHEGAEYVDNFGRTYDQIGNPDTSAYWKTGKHTRQFLESIWEHVNKSNHYTVIDMTGFTAQQKEIATWFISGLPPDKQAVIIKIGF